MEKRRFYILDVFAEEKYAGNQLAVVRDAGGLSDSQLQKIAKEMNYSETTFILSEEQRNGGYDVRIFTLETELSHLKLYRNRQLNTDYFTLVAGYLHRISLF